MSIERELLEKVISGDNKGDFFISYDLYKEIHEFLAKPKREPFGPEERQRLSKAYSTRAEQVAFEEGIIFAEISYGIGGGE